MVGTSVNLEVSGYGGGCYVDIDWGDGDISQGVWVDLVPNPSQRTISHTYTGWGGGKTVEGRAILSRPNDSRVFRKH